MKTIGGFNFPEIRDELAVWKPAIFRRSLARRVLAVAKTRAEGTWTAYIDAVPGFNHDEEFQAILVSGDKLPKNVACALFPYMADVPYAD